MNDGGATKRRADLMFDKILDLTQVKSVTVGGVEIPMREKTRSGRERSIPAASSRKRTAAPLSLVRTTSLGALAGQPVRHDQFRALPPGTGVVGHAAGELRREGALQPVQQLDAVCVHLPPLCL